MQQFIAIGRLTKDVETTNTSNGTTVAHITLAVERNRTNANNEKETDFFNTIVYGKPAETCSKYLKKGSQIAVVGSVQTRSYDAKDGTKRYITEIIADRVHFLATGNTTNKQGNVTQQTATPELEEISSDDLLF